VGSADRFRGLEISTRGLPGGCLAIVWTVRELGTTFSILVGVLSLGIAALVIWLRYHDDEL
jgi:hypothetical protein